MAIQAPAPAAYEDSQVRFAAPIDQNARNIWIKYIKKSYTLTDGPNSGESVDYFEPEFNVVIAGAPGTVVANQGTPTSVSNAWPVTEVFGGVAIDPRNIRLLTTADAITAFQGTSPWVISSAQLPASLTADGTLKVSTLNSLIPVAYDTVQLSYTGDNLTSAVFKTGLVTVATLTLSYTGDNLTSVVRS
jgi:hypothetical protein